MNKSSDKQLQKKGLLWNLIGNLTYLFLQWATTIIITRIAGFSIAGNFSLAMSVTSVFTSIATWSLRQYQASDVSGEYTDKLYCITRVSTCTLSILLCLIFVFLKDYSIDQQGIIMAYMVYRAIEAFIDVFQGIEQKVWRFDIIGKSLIFRGLISDFVLSVVLLFTKNLLLSIVVIDILLVLFIIFYDCRQVLVIGNFIGEVSVRQLLQLLQKSLPIVLASFISNIIITYPRVAIEQYLGSEMLGIYAGIATPVLLIQATGVYLYTPFIPVFAKRFQNKQNRKFIELIFTCSLVFLTLGIFAIIFVQVCGTPLMQLLFGSKILPYMNLMLPMICVTLCTTYLWFLSMLLTVTKNLKGLLSVNIIGILINIIITKPLVVIMGINGANISLIITTVTIIIIMVLLLVFDIFQNRRMR